MKVYELMQQLSKAPAGDEVLVSVNGVASTTVNYAEPEEDSFVIYGNDAQVLDYAGNEIGTVEEVRDNMATE